MKQQLVADIHELIAAFEARDFGYYYRGEPRAGLRLLPRVGRILPEIAKKAERILLDRLKEDALPFLGYHPRNDWEWLALPSITACRRGCVT